jgi:transcriptional regulator with XRE-family HTH domain
VRLEAEGFGGQLRRHRVLAGLSQEALAERAGLSRRGIADLERGARRFPYPDTASRLANALELSGADREAFLAASRPSRSTWSKHSPLPVEPSVLVGRQAELAALRALIGNTRLLTLWDLEAANAVCAWEPLAPHQVLDSLVSLVDKSLVLAEDVESQRRHRFLETIREYAAERLAASAEVGPTRGRHASYFLSIALRR